MTGRELEAEIQSLLDGSLPAGRAAALHARLAADPSAREIYLEYVALHQALGFRMARRGESRPPQLEKSRPRVGRPVLGWSILAAAAAVVIAAILLKVRPHESTPPMAILKDSPGTKYSVVPGGDAPAGSRELPEGSVVSLSQGTLDLDLPGGSRVVVQAPARFALVSNSLVDLDHGSAFFQVAAEDRNFVVRHRDFVIEEPDTAFGISAQPGGASEVHAIRGKINVTAQTGRSESVALLAGEARRIDPRGEPVSIQADAGEFLPSLPPGLGELHFPFDTVTGPSIPVAGSLPKATLVHAVYRDASGRPARPTLVPGKIGSALALSGNGDHIETDWPGFVGDLPRSVSFWTKVEPGTSFTHMPAVANWGDPIGDFQKWKVMLAQEIPGDPVVARISMGAVAFDGSTPLTDGRWHHCVAVFSRAHAPGHPDNFAIYIDGRRETLRRRQFALLEDPEAVDQPDTTTTTRRALPLLIGKSVDPRYGSFPGLIDELRIHAGALAEEDVLRLLAEGDKK